MNKLVTTVTGKQLQYKEEIDSDDEEDPEAIAKR
jgi:hypothetical protein